MSKSQSQAVRPKRNSWIEAIDAFRLEHTAALLKPLADLDANKRHDVFNLAALPVVILATFAFVTGRIGFPMLLAASYSYFLADLLWVWMDPSCVKSPGVIAGHHLLTLGYMLLPAFDPSLREYMAWCLTVEINTFFLILRRLWRRKVVSVCFYVTWITIRLCLYPALVVEFANLYAEQLRRGRYVHHLALPPLLQGVLCLLNIKWTIDLVRSKISMLRDQKSYQPSKGL
mmetsp:Transcript_14071/g.47632  ORF Transcript_14071/g.47632 Transcript_14071/m.47632 type:complete len:230 (+) Transcript_14071:66-755(+)